MKLCSFFSCWFLPNSQNLNYMVCCYNSTTLPWPNPFRQSAKPAKISPLTSYCYRLSSSESEWSEFMCQYAPLLPVILPINPFRLAPTKPDIWAPRLTPIMWMELREAPWSCKELVISLITHNSLWHSSDTDGHRECQIYVIPASFQWKQWGWLLLSLCSPLPWDSSNW